MTTNKPVLPNFLKVVLFAAAASMSLSSFAGHHEKGKAAVGDLKDMTTDTGASLETTQDELKAMLSEGEAATDAEAEAADAVDGIEGEMMNDVKDVQLPTPE